MNKCVVSRLLNNQIVLGSVSLWASVFYYSLGVTKALWLDLADGRGKKLFRCIHVCSGEERVCASVCLSLYLPPHYRWINDAAVSTSPLLSGSAKHTDKIRTQFTKTNYGGWIVQLKKLIQHQMIETHKRIQKWFLRNISIV